MRLSSAPKHTLCSLCRIRGGSDPADASLEDIRNLAKDMIEIYKTCVCLEESDCPIHWAMDTDNICLLSLFLSYETADANCLLDRSSPPLMTQFSYRKLSFYLPCIRLLLEHGAHLDFEDTGLGIKAFHVILLTLTSTELDIFMRKYHLVIKHLAEECDSVPVVHGLILHSVWIARHRTNRRPVEPDILDRLKILTKYYQKLDSRDLHGRTVLHYACWLKYPTVLEYLLAFGMEPHQTDNFGRGCLYYAISHPINHYTSLRTEAQLTRTLELIVRALGNSATEIRDNLGRSAFHIACFENNTPALEYLLKSGFNIDACDHQGKYPLDYASAECAEIIRRYGIISEESVEMYPRYQNILSDVTVIYSRQPCSEVSERMHDNFDECTNKRNISTLCNTSIEDIKNKHVGIKAAMNVSHKTADSLLSDPEFGVLKDSDVMYIRNDIRRLIDKLAMELEKVEPRFLSTVQLGGSVSEGTKLKPANEFDFQFHLNRISYYFVIKRLKPGNDASMAITHTSESYPLIKDLIKPGVSANQALFNAFHSAVYKIIDNKSFWKDLPFYWHRHSIAISSSKRRVFSKDKVTAPFRLKWVGLQQGDIDISVDLVPILGVDRLPNSALTVIPKEVIKFVDKTGLKWHVVSRDSIDGRLSFFPVEKYILCRLMPELRKAYTLAKAISKYCCEKFFLDSDYITSYMLKNALFYELDPDTSFGLLNSQIMSYKSVSDYQTAVLSSMRETLTCTISSTECFIQSWTWKIFDKLESWFSSEEGVHVYCRPTETFPDVMVVDFENVNPHLKSLQKFKEMLKV